MSTYPKLDKEAKQLAFTPRAEKRIKELLYGLAQITSYRETNGEPTVEAKIARRVLDGIHFTEDTDNDAVSPMICP